MIPQATAHWIPLYSRQISPTSPQSQVAPPLRSWLPPISASIGVQSILHIIARYRSFYLRILDSKIDINLTSQRKHLNLLNSVITKPNHSIMRLGVACKRQIVASGHWASIELQSVHALSTISTF
jgi:hypothetical protein